MADPVVTAIPIDTWVKVATGVTSGKIMPLLRVMTDQSKSGYVQTIRDTGNAAPTNGDLSQAKGIPWSGALISTTSAIDVYIAVVGDVAGSVRVDL